jgi:hypothetical protein
VPVKPASETPIVCPGTRDGALPRQGRAHEDGAQEASARSRQSDDDDNDAASAQIPNDLFMGQFAAYLARQSNLVKLSDYGNKVTYGKPAGDDLYVCEDNAFVKVEEGALSRPSGPPGGKRLRLEPANEKILTNPFDDFCMSDDVLASIPLP